MILQDFHMHTTYCDGKNTPEEMVRTAMDLGLERIGICVHAHTAFDESYCIKKADIAVFQAEIAALKEKHKGKIEILCGVEQDYFSTETTDGFDYVIGSVHYVKKDGVYIDVDESAETQKKAIETCYGGDALAFAEDYFALVGDVLGVTNADIIGHFDLVSKFNETGSIFDENHPRYIAAWMAAIDKLLPYQKPFEINTGAISRGYKKMPYPSEDILRYIHQNGGSAIITSDAHSTDGLCCAFDEAEKLAREVGFEL